MDVKKFLLSRLPNRATFSGERMAAIEELKERINLEVEAEGFVIFSISVTDAKFFRLIP